MYYKQRGQSHFVIVLNSRKTLYCFKLTIGFYHLSRYTQELVSKLFFFDVGLPMSSAAEKRAEHAGAPVKSLDAPTNGELTASDKTRKKLNV